MLKPLEMNDNKTQRQTEKNGRKLQSFPWNSLEWIHRLEWIQSRKREKKLPPRSASTSLFTKVLPSMSCTKVTLSSWFRGSAGFKNRRSREQTHTHTRTRTSATNKAPRFGVYHSCGWTPPQSQPQSPHPDVRQNQRGSWADGANQSARTGWSRAWCLLSWCELREPGWAWRGRSRRPISRSESIRGATAASVSTSITITTTRERPEVAFRSRLPPPLCGVGPPSE